MSETVDTADVAPEAPPEMPEDVPEPAAPDPESEAAVHRRALEEAAAAHEAAIATVAERHEAVQAVSREIAKANARRAELDAMPELDMNLLLEDRNLEKRLRALDAQWNAAQAALTAAGEAQDEKELQLRRAKVIEGDTRLQQMDTDYIEFVHAFAERAAEKRAAAFLLSRELHALEADATSSNWSDSPTPRGRFMLAVPESREQPFSSNAVEDAHKLLLNLTNYAQMQVTEEQHEAAATSRRLYVDRDRKKTQSPFDKLREDR